MRGVLVFKSLKTTKQQQHITQIFFYLEICISELLTVNHNYL